MRERDDVVGERFGGDCMSNMLRLPWTLVAGDFVGFAWALAAGSVDVEGCWLASSSRRGGLLPWTTDS